MASINTFTIVGNVTKDVELRYTPSGTPSVTFTVAVDNVYFDRDGRFVRINRWMAGINGLPVDDHLGRRISDLLPLSLIHI